MIFHLKNEFGTLEDHSKQKKSSGCFVTTIEEKLVPILRKDLENLGFVFLKPPYTHYQAKKASVSCILYLSGKLTIQGSGSNEIIDLISSAYLFNNKSFEDHIGSDESGKGDFFGPLCVSAVFVNKESLSHLQKLGIKDSKEMSDDSILAVTKDIEALTINQTICLFPETYNRLYARFKNLNKLLGWAHFEVLHKVSVKSQCHKALIDQFANPQLMEEIVSYKKSNLILEQRTKAESDIAVAAASILARTAFLEGLKKMEEDFGVTLPKGASSAVANMALRIARESGISLLEKVSKTHFKTYKETLGRL
ncbi:MAG: ribonuclease HIII [Chlamydiae bacterium]|nr:ribonuclease HIII [Chlamydiota bacterium]